MTRPFVVYELSKGYYWEDEDTLALYATLDDLRADLNQLCPELGQHPALVDGDTSEYLGCIYQSYTGAKFHVQRRAVSRMSPEYIAEIAACYFKDKDA